jgi:cobalt/nickel transport system permease protein
MSGSHAESLTYTGASPFFAIAPQVKIVAALGFIVAVVLTPRQAVWAFAAYAAMWALLVAAARLPVRFVLARMIVEVPFILLALSFPILGPGERVEVGSLSLSVAGLWDMWNVLAKATLGLGVAVVLAATTHVTDMLRGLEALHVPEIVTAIISFMLRYVDVVASDLVRMRIALASRGHETRSIRSWGPYARSMGSMFVRTYERGERVYLAMQSRGYAGSMPQSTRVAAGRGQWSGAVVLVTAAALVMLAAWMTL